MYWPSAEKPGRSASNAPCGTGVATGIDGDGNGVAVGVGDGSVWVGRGVGLASATPLGGANVGRCRRERDEAYGEDRQRD
jgi:hypothetical protein